MRQLECAKKIETYIKVIDSNIGKKIYRARISMGMSRQKLALSIGVSQQQLTKYENGANKVSIGRLSLIANVLDCGFGYFYSDLGNDKENSFVEQQGESKEFLQLVKHLSKLTNQNQLKALYSLVDSMLVK